MVVPRRHVATLGGLDDDELLDVARTDAAGRGGADRGLPAAGHERRHEPRPAGRRRHRRSPARAPGAALERRHQLHAGGRQRARPARRPAGRPRSGCGRCSRGSPPSRPSAAWRHDLRSRRHDRAPSRDRGRARRPPDWRPPPHDLDAVGGSCRAPPGPRRAPLCLPPDVPLPWVVAIEEIAAVSGSLARRRRSAGRRLAPAPRSWMGLRGVDLDGARRARDQRGPRPRRRRGAGRAGARRDRRRARRPARGQGRRRASRSSSTGRLADAATEVDAARLLLWRAAAAVPPPADGVPAAMARMQARAAAESAVAVAAAGAGRRGRSGRHARWTGSPATWRRRRWCSAAPTARKRRSPPACCPASDGRGLGRRADDVADLADLPLDVGAADLGRVERHPHGRVAMRGRHLLHARQRRRRRAARRSRSPPQVMPVTGSVTSVLIRGLHLAPGSAWRSSPAACSTCPS